MQVGTSEPPRFAPSKDYLTYEEMEQYLRRASVVVCHGGPATITLARFYGKLPVVMPRRKSLGEGVDDHQLFFCSRLAKEGAILLAEDEAALFAALEAGLQGKLLLSKREEAVVIEATRKFGALIEKLLEQKRIRR
uniref:Glycosyl transferase family 28 C-terminal domain-containing protein n=1 Tax=Ammonifex degensii TaxID=42838 RepID=A0A7C1JJT3_9THEO